jgi:oxalyl-CoA decarboxylase
VESDGSLMLNLQELATLKQLDLPITLVIMNNNGVYRGTDINPTGGPDVAPTVFVKGARYDRMMEAFGGIGRHATTPAELTAALKEAIASGKPTLINAVIDEKAGTESGRIGNLNPQSGAKKK